MHDSLSDPSLKSLEARLAATPPQLSERDRQALLYQCAFAAGRHDAAARIRRWQGASALLAILLVGMTLTLATWPKGATVTAPEPGNHAPDESRPRLMASAPPIHALPSDTGDGSPYVSDPLSDPIENIMTSFESRLRVQ